MIHKWKGFWDWLKYTGLWLPPPLIILTGLLTYYGYCSVNVIIGTMACTLLLSLAISLWIWSLNSIAKRNGLQEFPLIPYNVDQNPYYQVSYRTQALCKKPDKRLLYKDPQGIVLGKADGKYLSIMPGITPGATHTLVLGTSGSGKTSSVLLSTLLANRISKDKYAFLLVDVKGELLQKGFAKGDKVAVFNPRRRDLYGFDFLYDIDEKSTELEVIEALRRVIYSLIPLKHTGDEFWPVAARTVLLGLFLYAWEYQQYYTIPQLVDFALSKNLNTLISDVIAEAEENSVVTRLLSSYGGDCVAEETLGSISSNIGNALQLFSSDSNLRYLTKEADRKITPELLEKGISIDLLIEDRDLETYAPILSLAVATCITYLSSPSREKAVAQDPLHSQVVFVLDELGRIPEIQGLPSILQIGRSRGCTVLGCLQSWSSAEDHYGEKVAADMLTNFSYRVFLQCQPESKDVEMAVKAFGKYTEKKKSVNTGKNKSYSYQFEEKDILQASDLLTSPDKNKVVVLSPYGAYMLQRCQYFRDKKLKEIADQIKNDRENHEEK